MTDEHDHLPERMLYQSEGLPDWVDIPEPIPGSMAWHRDQPEQALRELGRAFGEAVRASRLGRWLHL